MDETRRSLSFLRDPLPSSAGCLGVQRQFTSFRAAVTRSARVFAGCRGVAPMPIGGKLVLKGGESLGGGVKKKKKKGKKKAAAAGDEEAQGGDGEVKSKADYRYEKEFTFEEERRADPKVKNTPWGSSYRAAPEILHGYDRKVSGVNAEERLDMRCATKADKFCK